VRRVRAVLREYQSTASSKDRMLPTIKNFLLTAGRGLGRQLSPRLLFASSRKTPAGSSRERSAGAALERAFALRPSMAQQQPWRPRPRSEHRRNPARRPRPSGRRERSNAMKSLVAGLWCFFPTWSLATTLVAIRTPDFVVLAADSKRFYKGEPGPPKVCKIYRSEHIYFAIAGFTGDTLHNRLTGETRSNFDPKTVIAEALAHPESIEVRIKRAESSLSKAISAEMHRLSIENPGAYRDTVGMGGGTIAEVIFVWYERNVPSVVTSDFQLRAAKVATVTIERTSCPGSCRGSIVVSSGVNDAIKDYLVRHGADLSNPIPLANRLIQRQLIRHRRMWGRLSQFSGSIMMARIGFKTG
jgi:hypothetical protein